MKKKAYLILSLFTIIFSIGLKAQKASIPFHINEYNNIVLHYTINGKKLNLIIDTAIPFNLIDKEISESINFGVPNNDKVVQISTIQQILINVIMPKGEQPYKQDSIFWGGWMTTNMKETAETLMLGDNVDGIVGYDSDYILEFDFKKNKLLVWDSLETKRFEKRRFKKIKLVNSNYGGTGRFKALGNPISVHSELTVLDTVKLQPNLILDTGASDYVNLVFYDKELLNKMVAFRKEKGENYPTIQLKIPALGIDKAFAGISVSDNSNDGLNLFGSELGGLLGVEFMRQFRRVVIDRKNQFAWFQEY